MKWSHYNDSKITEEELETLYEALAMKYQPKPRTWWTKPVVNKPIISNVMDSIRPTMTDRYYIEMHEIKGSIMCDRYYGRKPRIMRDRY